MARVNNLSNFLTDVASAIKTKKGSETAIPAADFDTEILALPSQGVYQTKVITINENGQTIITPDSGYDAMDGVQVTTNVPEKQLQTKSYNFTTNQTIELLPDTDYDGFDQVNLEINVPSGEVNNQDKEITENGTYTADEGYTGIGTATVNVPQPQDLNLVLLDNISYDMYSSESSAFQLGTIPKGLTNFDIIYNLYGSWSSTKPENYSEYDVNNGIFGRINYVEGTVTDAIEFNLNSMDCKYAYAKIVITADGYKPFIKYIEISKVTHDYGMYVVQWCSEKLVGKTAQLSILVKNMNDETIVPVNIVWDSNYYYPTSKIFLSPEDSYMVYLMLNGDIVADTGGYNWISYDSNIWNYVYSFNIPGFTYRTEFFVNTESNTWSNVLGYSACKIYDAENTLLDTITTDMSLGGYHQINYDRAFDHYTVDNYCWSVDNTISVEGIGDLQDTTTFNSTAYCFGLCSIELDGNKIYRNNDALLTDFGIQVVEKNLTTGIETDVTSTNAMVHYDNNYAWIAIRYTNDSNIQMIIRTTDSHYELSEIMMGNNSFGFGTTLQVYTKVPVITQIIDLCDIDGTPIPYSDIDELSFGDELRVHNAITSAITESETHTAQITLTANRRISGDVYLQGNMYNAPQQLLLTLNTISQYEEDTTLTTSLNLLGCIDTNYKVVYFTCTTTDDTNLNHYVLDLIPVIYQTNDHSVTYTPVKLSTFIENVGNGEYVCKLPRNINLEIPMNIATINNVEYRIPGATYTITDTGYGAKYNPWNWGSLSITINNTCAISWFGIRYASGTEQIDYTHDYKIEGYRNGIKIDEKYPLYSSYDCKVSFLEGDTAEFRVYKNEGTQNEPIWKTRYYANTFTITNDMLNKKVWMPNDDIGTFNHALCLAEVNAYIEDIPFVNPYTSRIVCENDLNDLGPINNGDSITGHITAYNGNGEDISDIWEGMSWKIYGLDADKYYFDFDIKEVIYIGADPMPVGSYFVNQCFVFNGKVSTSGTAFNIEVKR